MREARINGETNRDLKGLPIMLTLSATTPTYTMKPSDKVIIAISSQADGASIIYLPSVAEAVGQGVYLIVATTGASGGDISVYEKETGAELTTYGDLDADDDHVGLISDGTTWRVILDGVA